MPKKDISKSEVRKAIEEFFSQINKKSQKEVKKIKKLVMRNKIPLKTYRKLFCKKCFIPYSGQEKVRIKNGMKSIECVNCKETGRWAVK